MNSTKIIIFNKEKHKKLMDNGNMCLCTIDAVKCICNEFKNNPEPHVCHCGVYEKVLIETGDDE